MIKPKGIFLCAAALPEENRPIGRYGRLHREYLKQEHPARYSSFILTGKICGIKRLSA